MPVTNSIVEKESVTVIVAVLEHSRKIKMCQIQFTVVFKMKLGGTEITQNKG